LFLYFIWFVLFVSLFLNLNVVLPLPAADDHVLADAMVQGGIPDVLALDDWELWHTGTHPLACSIIHGAKEGSVASTLCCILTLVVVHVSLRVVGLNVSIKGGVKPAEALKDSAVPGGDVVRLLINVLELCRQGKAHGDVAELKAAAVARVDGEVLLIEDAVAFKGLLCQGTGDGLCLHDELPHLWRGHDGGLEASGLACQEVGQLLDVASATAGGLVGGGTVLKGWGEDLVVKEEEVILEGDATPQADVARDKEGVALKVVLLVKAPNDTANLLGLLRVLHLGQGDDGGGNPLAIWDANLLAQPVQDDHGSAHRERPLAVGLVALAHHLHRGEGAGARLEVALWVCLGHFLDEGLCGHLLVGDELHGVVLYTEVDGQRGVLKANDTDALELLDDGVHGGGDHGHLLHKGVLANVLEVSVTPVAHAGVCLVNPDVGLDGGLEALEVGRELRDDGREVVEANAVGAADHHGYLKGHNLAHEVVHGDAHAGAAAPAKDTALNDGVRLRGLKELVVHAHRGLLNQAEVVRLDEEVQVKARRSLFLLLNHVRDAACLTALAIEREHTELRVSGTHDCCLIGGRAKSPLTYFNFYSFFKR